MAAISTLSINIQTGTDSGADTDGDVYVGLGGREFYLDTSADDFERGSSRTYILGDGSNVLEKAFNDPRKPQLFDENLQFFPVYIRFVGRTRGDNWRLKGGSITLNGSTFPRYQIPPAFEGIWLGIRAGLVFYIPEHLDIG